VLARTFVLVVLIVFGALAASLAIAGSPAVSPADGSSTDFPLEADVSASRPTHADAPATDGAIFMPFAEARSSLPERDATPYRYVAGADWTLSIVAASMALVAVGYCLRLAWTG
jgi:hypothetical protein